MMKYTLTPQQIKKYKELISKCLRTTSKGSYSKMTDAEARLADKNDRIISIATMKLLQNYGIKKHYVGHDYNMYLENLSDGRIYAYINFDFKLNWWPECKVSQDKRNIIKYYYQVYLKINNENR